MNSENSTTTASFPRPRRALPPMAKRILTRWLAAHSRWPYPTTAEKNELAEYTRLPRKKIDRWFVNARRRSPLILRDFYQQRREH